MQQKVLSKYVGKRLGIVAIVAASILLVFLLARVQMSVSAVEKISALVPLFESSQDAEELLREASSDVFEIQAARRGFVLTGDEQFAKAFDASAGQLKVDFQKLQAAMGQQYGPESDTALQLARVLKLGNTYEAQLRGSILQRRNQPEALLEQQALTIEGETLSRAIHTDLKALEQGLSRQFDTDLRSMLSNIGGVEKSQTWLTIASLVVFSFACFAVFFEIRQRLVLQRSLADANENLERKVLERTAEFTAGESRFRRLVDLSADAIILCDADRSIQYANPAAQTLVKGGAEQSLNGLAVDSIFFGEDMQWIRQWLASLVDSPQQHALRDAVLVSEGGKKIPVQLSLVSYADQDRIRAQIVLHDMTQLRANEIAVKEQLRFIDQLLEAIPLPLSVRDERGRYLRINRAYEMAYNCKRYEISQRSVFDVLGLSPVLCEESPCWPGAIER